MLASFIDAHKTWVPNLNKCFNLLVARKLRPAATGAASADLQKRPRPRSEFNAPSELQPTLCMIWDFCHRYRWVVPRPCTCKAAHCNADMNSRQHLEISLCRHICSHSALLRATSRQLLRLPPFPLVRLEAAFLDSPEHLLPDRASCQGGSAGGSPALRCRTAKYSRYG